MTAYPCSGREYTLIYNYATEPTGESVIACFSVWGSELGQIGNSNDPMGTSGQSLGGLCCFGWLILCAPQELSARINLDDIVSMGNGRGALVDGSVG